MLTLHFLSELPKLIISGLAEPCQEQEPTAKPRPGQALPAHSVTSAPHPYLTPLQLPVCSAALGPNRRRCLSVLAGPGLARCHRAFACSGVLIKSFIVLHSRKELRRNTEQDGAKGRREKKGGGSDGRGTRTGGKLGFFIYFFLLLSPFHFLLD